MPLGCSTSGYGGFRPSVHDFDKPKLMTISVDWLRKEFPDLSYVAPLGKGGYKTVFSATHPSEGDVVLKLIRLDADAEEVRREIRAVLKVASLRVPRILDHGQRPTPMGPCFWLREQRIIGVPLRAVLSAGPLMPSEVLRLTHHLLQALADAERVRIVHRDVKPENIMRDNAGDFWLLDFGIARHLDLHSITATANAWGKMTVGYAPTEQCRNLKADIDSRVDLFALGVTIHEAATGKHTFREGASSPLEVIRRMETVALPPLTLPIEATNEFRDLVSSITQKRRDHRLSTAREALEWCEEILAKQVVL